MNKIFCAICGLWFCSLLVAAGADSYSLTDGSSLTGDTVTFNDNGITLRLTNDSYTNVMWTKFSQDALRQLSQNPKIKPLVEPFVEIPESERPKKPEIKVHDVTRLELPAKQSLIGALFSSSVGLFALFLIYAANIYSGYEIAIARARPKALVMGAAVILPILGPIIFLSMPVYVKPTPVEEQVPAEEQTFAMPGQPAPQAEAAAAISLSETARRKASLPESQIFQRGQFTFNRRFFETKFSNYFGTTRREADRDMVLTVKTTRGQFVVQRISRIAANDVHLETIQGAARQEIMVPFADIQEIQLKHKDA
ncbi:MAG TPA: hypothetical protein VHG89_12225 [Verrucomicrobiae bacterium]|nr:hypothetical protein [Verrucomicrobiae bacterium]